MRKRDNGNAENTRDCPIGYLFAMPARERAVENARTLVFSANTEGLRAFLFSAAWRGET